MTLTFGQYTILMATRHGVTLTQLAQRTNFDHTLITYFVNELMSCGLLTASNETNAEQVYYELTDSSFAYIEDYERQNPDLIINGVFS